MSGALATLTQLRYLFGGSMGLLPPYSRSRACVSAGKLRKSSLLWELHKRGALKTSATLLSGGSDATRESFPAQLPVTGVGRGVD